MQYKKEDKYAAMEQKTIHKKVVVKILYIVGGTVSLALGLLGIILPGLPTTPFLLLAGWLYARSSQKMYDKLLSNRLLGSKIKEYRKRKGVPKREKLKIFGLTAAMTLFSSFVMIHDTSLRIIVLIFGTIGIITMAFFVPTAKD